jgi:hypothetical protein
MNELKKRVFIKCLPIIALLFTLQFNYAQSIDFGPKLGANFATFGDLSSFDNEIGFVGGAFFGLKFSKIGIQTEVLYSQQGEDFGFDQFNLDYINIPIAIKIYVLGSLNLQLGPQFGFLINDNIIDDVVESIEKESFDLNAFGGLGLDLPLNLNVDARYIFDISDNFTASGFGNGFFSLAVGFSFF